MAIDPRHLGPTKLCGLLNSTPLGEVISQRQLHRHRTRAGYRIGDGKTVDLLKYVAWLVWTRHEPKPEPEGLIGYDAMREQARARNALLSQSGRDIGELPTIVDPERRAKAAGSFRFFCETYFPLTFHLAWSPDHLKVIAKIEQAVTDGGLFALAMPRGSGKTTLAECACLWAILFGFHEFLALIGASEAHAEEMLDSIKMELEGNDLLLEDFPEVAFPIQSLEGIANRCAGQLYRGERTHIVWTAKEIVLPTVEGSKASGGTIKVAGITGRIRGMKYKRADGRTVRPSLVILDDPQTDESARSPSQCAQRESILAGAVLGLAGPGRKISGIMPCTVIRPDDMADRMLTDLLQKESIDPATVLVMRHCPVEPALRERIGWLASEKEDVFNAYQQTQTPRAEKQLQSVDYLASFLAHGPGKAVLVGLYRVKGSGTLSRDKFLAKPAVQSLIESGEGPLNRKSVVWFDLELTKSFALWKGKLIVRWPGKEINWCQRVKPGKFEIDAILDEPVLVKPLSDWREQTFSWHDLQLIPRSWRDILAQWQGIYYIFDTKARLGYVGSAYGKDNLLGRWLNYAKTGHGGNKLLIPRDPAKFQFSILELIDSGTGKNEVQERETSWKIRLHTRTHGLNEN